MIFDPGQKWVEGKPLQVEPTGKTGVNEQQPARPLHQLHLHLQHLRVLHLPVHHLCWQLLYQLQVTQQD